MKDKKVKKHGYLNELFGKDLPYPFCKKNYPIFDARDTWNLDDTFFLWFYERLRYFQDKVSKIIDLNCQEQTFDIDGEKLTLADCISRMIEDCKKLIQYDDEYDDNMGEEYKDDFFKILSKTIFALWW